MNRQMTAQDAAHEAHIKNLSQQFLAHHARYEASGCFADLGAADGIRLQMEAAIKARSPAAVAVLEVERGLA